MKVLLYICALFICGNSLTFAQQEDLSAWNSFETAFIKDVRRLHIPYLRIGYVDNLELIQNKRTIDTQERVFEKYKVALQTIDHSKLTPEQQLDYAIVAYEIDLHLKRIALEKEWLALKPKRISEEGLQHVPMGKQWYAYFLQKWVDASVTPDEIYQFGLSEIARAKTAMQAIQKASGLDSITFQRYIHTTPFFYNDVATVQQNFETYKEQLLPKLIGAFPKVNELPDVEIKRGRNRAYVQVPAYYVNAERTFYYNYFDKPFNKRQVAWIYMHEAIPGHHYQIQFEEQVEKSEIRNEFTYGGYREGWAAYVEELGNEFGAYETIYDELGKWEWDIIRSVRVSMDVGLNYYGWSDEEALAFWKQHIKGQDDIGQREINRMKRWPAQVITYKYGADKILQWKKQWKATLPEGTKFPWLAFHTKVLQYGSLPFSVMDTVIFGN